MREREQRKRGRERMRVIEKKIEREERENMVWNKRVVTYEEHDASQGTATGFLSVHLQWAERERG